MLGEYGYGIDVTARYDVATTETVTAFQRHFRQTQVDGIADPVTQQILRKLLIARDNANKRRPAVAEAISALPKDLWPSS